MAASTRAQELLLTELKAQVAASQIEPKPVAPPIVDAWASAVPGPRRGFQLAVFVAMPDLVAQGFVELTKLLETEGGREKLPASG